MATPQAPPCTPQGVRCREVLNEVGFQGTATAFQASLMNQSLLMLAALVTVYLIVGVLYASDMHPVSMLSTLPSAGVGALLALLLCRTDLHVIVRIGIVKKNAIMMIDFALEAERSERKSPVEAIFQACLLRLRPIIMTTMAVLWAACRRRSAWAPAPSCAGRWASPSSVACCPASCSRCARRRSSICISTACKSGVHSSAADAYEGYQRSSTRGIAGVVSG
jgi:hypothetical protein